MAPIKCLAILIKFGLVELKSFLYKNSFLNVKNLPIDKDVLKFIENWKTKNNGDVVLISASHELYVQDIAKHINIFDACYGSSKNNLKSTQKLKTINNYSQEIPFDYVGNSIDDFAIWEYASNPILVNPSNYVKNKAKIEKILLLSAIKIIIYNLFKLIIPINDKKHVVILTNGAFNVVFIGFIQLNLWLCLIFTNRISFYAFNDLLDIESDKAYNKKFRPWHLVR